MAYQTLLQEYMLIPPVTRAYTTACVITTLAVVSILQFFNTNNNNNISEIRVCHVQGTL